MLRQRALARSEGSTRVGICAAIGRARPVVNRRRNEPAAARRRMRITAAI
jgi:hypothetical protein